MKPTNRIIFNTVVLYAKILICMAISLWTVPLVLKALGKEDFGLYNLVAGIVVMLSFLNGAMTVSTQRYLSVTMGEGDKWKLLEIYNLSVLLHFVIGAVVVLMVEIFAPFLFDYVLNIDPLRLDTAKILLHYLVISMFFTIFMVPFDAVLNAYENMFVFSVIGVIESVLKLGVALCLPFIPFDKLEFYGIAIVGVTIFVFMLKFAYTHFRYKDLRLSFSALHNMKLFWSMFGFAGWNTILSLSMIFRNQGLAVVLNHFFGTIVNAAYGIANSINGVVSYFSSTIQKSINPQLMQSRGAHDDEKLLGLTFGLSKFSTLCMGIVAIPLIVEMPYILDVWLPTVPEGTVAISRLIIILSLIYQLSSGLMSAIQSTGQVKWYSITMGTMLISTIPIAYGVLKGGAVMESALYVACTIEFLSLWVRLGFVKKFVGISVKEYVGRIILPLTVLFIITGIVLWCITMAMESSVYRLAIICVVDVAVYCLIAYKYLLSRSERAYIDNLKTKILRR